MLTKGRNHCLVALWAAAAVGGWLAGCSPAPANVAPVSGQVTLGGTPLAGTTVTFQPVSTGAERTPGVSGSVGKTNAEGRYTLRLIEPDVPGAVLGKHAVTITSATVAGSDDATRPTGERAAARWRDGSQTFEVPAGGTQRADFDVQ